jgi:hypothetical protein
MPSTVKANYITCHDTLTAPTIIGDLTGNVTGSVTGGVQMSITDVSAATYTVTSTDNVLNCDTTSNAITITLLAASADYKGTSITILDASGTFGTNNVTVESSNETDTIQGSTEDLIINVNNSSVDLLCTSATGYNIV